MPTLKLGSKVLECKVFRVSKLVVATRVLGNEKVTLGYY